MNHLHRIWKAVPALVVLATVAASNTNASAEPKNVQKDQKEHHGSGGPLPGKPESPGVHGDHGRGKSNGDPDKSNSADTEGRHSQMTPEMKKRIDELRDKETKGTLSADEKTELTQLEQAHHPRQTAEQRKARIQELSQKQAAGKLTDAEKTEFDRAQNIQARHDGLEKQDAARAQNRKDRSRNSKRDALKEYPNLNKDANAVAEYQKHAERLAKLERAKELATADGRTDVATKTDALIAKENERHQAWVTKHATDVKPATQGAAQ